MIDLVAFRHEDEMDTTYLRELPRTEKFGDRKFPHPDAYHHAVAAETADSDTSETARHYAEAQRDWHVRGQNGCQFARLVAKDAEEVGWDYAVYGGDPQAVTSQIVAKLNAQVTDAIVRPETNVLIHAPAVWWVVYSQHHQCSRWPLWRLERHAASSPWLLQKPKN